eukprot:symbB.v1.2.008488.t1/scaffold535.1/size190655/8
MVSISRLWSEKKLRTQKRWRRRKECNQTKQDAKRRKVGDVYPARGNRFQDKVAVITGAAGNFGAVCARMMAAEGAKLALVDLVEDKLQAVAAEVRETYKVPVKAFALDVTKDADVEKTVAEIKKEFGHIDCLFNNAGYQGLFAPVDDYSAEDFDKAWRLGLGNNLKHVMIQQKAGSIVNTASCAGLGCPTAMPAYGTRRFRNAFRHWLPFTKGIDGSGGFETAKVPGIRLGSRARLVTTPSLLGMTLRVWLLPVCCSLCLAKPACESGTVCSEEEVEAWEEKIPSLELLQVSLETQKTETPPHPAIIGCFGGDKPVSVGCLNGSCTYRCKPEESYQEITCSSDKVIGTDACSGGGCSWSCKSILGCPQKPQMVGCDRMAPPLNHCIWTCPSTKSRIRCPGSVEPKQDACSGGGCSFLC